MNDVLIRAVEPRSLDDLRTQLEAAFVSVKNALSAGAGVVLFVDAGDLLGHGSVLGAAQANALVGLARAAAFEGARPGWKVNVVAAGGADAAAVADVGASLEHLTMSGQVLTVGVGLIGKVIP
jgi:NAD(P)-dependent dehydrogenase (short-subunit alcohol dehydrogenase family)